ncbi:MAG: hypothetical protein IIV05_04510, partial [Ruminococcus sp.]|nr:hypothetical protein [Ruminococcus sp.]
MELKRHSVRGVKYNGEEICGGFAYYDADEVDAFLAEKDKDIAYWREEYDKETQLTDALKDEIESLKASHYAESVDAGMRERRLRRALWIARAERAKEHLWHEVNADGSPKDDYKGHDWVLVQLQEF